MGGWEGGCVHNIDHPLKAGRFLLQLLVDGLPPNNINHSVYPLYILMLSINALSSHSSVHIFAKIFFLSITIIASPFSLLLRQNLMFCEIKPDRSGRMDLNYLKTTSTVFLFNILPVEAKLDNLQNSKFFSW